MSDSNQTNQFISAHNMSLTEGVFYFGLRGGRSSYDIIWDTRTHPLSLFTNSTKPEIIHNKPNEAKNKLFSNIRDKFNEADRPFVIRLYHNTETYKLFTQRIPTEVRPGVIAVVDNKPLFTEYPLWNFKNEPILSLIIRVKQVFTFFSHRDDFKERLLGMDSAAEETKIDYLCYIQDNEGQGPLLPLIFRQTRTMVASDISPKITSEIPFQPFVAMGQDCDIMLTDNTFLTAFDQYDIQPDYALVNRVSTKITMPLTHAGYRIRDWIDTRGNFFELCEGSDGKAFVIMILPDDNKQKIVPFEPSMLMQAMFLLYSRMPLLKLPATFASEVVYHMEGSYVAPERKIVSNIPFRDPMSCTSVEIEALKASDYPLIAQYKLDGNRILIHIMDGGASIKYYTRNGILQTAKFNQQFDKAVKELFLRIGPYRPANVVKNVMLDCECYCHDVVHSDIGGWCNTIQMTDNFRKLKLYLLSWLDFDTLIEIEERKRPYTVSPLTFEQSLCDIATFIDTTSNLLLNTSYLVRSQEELYDLMADSVEDGYEGLVVYPMKKRYTFSNAGLKKIKKFYDGECTVISYKESDTETGVIGSVYVKARASFSKDTNAPYVKFFVNGALRDVVKNNSMQAARFQQCIGKDFTIVCGSFSDTGVPIHARFKSAFGIENVRLDHV